MSTSHPLVCLFVYASACVAALLLCLAAGCGGGGGGGCPNPANIAGDWSGSVANDDFARGAPGSVQASFAMSACNVTGTSWSFSFATAPQLNQTFTVTGSAQGTSVSLDLRNTSTLCDFQVTGILVSSTEISGTYSTTADCSQSEAGSFDITLQARPTPTIAVATPTP